MKITSKAKIKHDCAFILILKPNLKVYEFMYVHIHTLLCKMVFLFNIIDQSWISTACVFNSSRKNTVEDRNDTGMRVCIASIKEIY